MENKYVAGIALTIVLLLSSGYAVSQYSAEDAEPNYLCESSKMLKYCARLSGTEITCYPTLEHNRGSKRCSSLWEPILPAEEEVRVVYKLVILPAPEDKKWVCNSNGCNKLD